MARFGAVARHQGVAARPAALVAQGGEVGGGPEPRAVLPRQPAVSGGAARGCGRVQRVFRVVAAGVVRREEAGERLAENFRLGVAEEAAGGVVPPGHAALGVEREDGAIGRGLQQQPEQRFGIGRRRRPVRGHASGPPGGALPQSLSGRVVGHRRAGARERPRTASRVAFTLGVASRVASAPGGGMTGEVLRVGDCDGCRSPGRPAGARRAIVKTVCIVPREPMG